MEKQGQVNTLHKKEKDGLSKKDRRAQKLQERTKQEATLNKPEQKPKEAVTEIKETKLTPELSDKQLRKLEWEKKLAEQKLNEAKSGDKVDGFSKAELKSKRREQQEAQRQAKNTTQQPQKAAAKPATELKPKTTDKPKEPSPVKNVVKKIKKPMDSTRVQMVTHLYAENLRLPEHENIILNYKNVHPVFVRLGVQYATKKILGSNARCLALLGAVKCLISDLQVPPKHEFCRYLETILQSCTAYLNHCRPFAVSMINALRQFKVNVRESTNLADNVKKTTLIDYIDSYIDEEINKADEAISLRVNEKICNGDVILTYGCSSLISKILLDAHKEMRHFEVIVADGRPLLEGRQMLKRLVQAGIQCTYIHINALSYVMNSVTKVLLGAHALLANGYVMSRIGTAQIALVAHAFNTPVLVCCETYKFSERVQTDSFVHNELLGDDDFLSTIDTLSEDSTQYLVKASSNLNTLNLLYDVTPPDFVTAVVTELAILPCTSVPVVLRIKPTEFM